MLQNNNLDEIHTDETVFILKRTITRRNKGHYKIFCVNVKYGIQNEFRIFLFHRFVK